MNLPTRIKQEMYYSKGMIKLPNKYIDDEGNEYEDGTYSDVYAQPIEFKGIINPMQLTEDQAKEFGVDASNSFSKLTCEKGELPLKYGSLIWKESPIEYDDVENNVPDKESADFTVRGILNEYMDIDFYLLERNIKNGGMQI